MNPSTDENDWLIISKFDKLFLAKCKSIINFDVLIAFFSFMGRQDDHINSSSFKAPT